MVIGSIVFAISAIVLLFDPITFINYIGLTSDDTLVWSFRLMGLVLIALATHMATTSRHAADPAFRRAATLMVLVSGGLAVLTYLAPGAATSGRWKAEIDSPEFSAGYEEMRARLSKSGVFF